MLQTFHIELKARANQSGYQNIHNAQFIVCKSHTIQ